jgi:hypothetical protein
MQQPLDANQGKSATYPNLPQGAEGHFLLHFYAVIARVLANLRATHPAHGEEESATYFEQFQFLKGYRRMLDAHLPGQLSPNEELVWWDAAIAQREEQSVCHLPLQALVEEADVGLDELRVLIAAGMVEEDIRFGAFFATLQEPLLARRPCIGTLDWLLGELAQAPANVWHACHRLLDAGLLQVDNRADPRSEWLLRVPAAIWDALRGQLLMRPAQGLTLQLIGDFPPLERLILPTRLHDLILRVPELLLSGQISSLVLRGMVGSGRRTILRAVAQALGRDILLWEGGTPGDENWRLLGPLATLTGAMPVLRFDLGPGETLDLPALPGYSGPTGITLGHNGGVRGPLLAHSLSLHVPPPDCDARRRFWLATTLPVEMEHLDDIAARFLLTGGHITRVAALAHTYALLDDRPSIAPSDVQQAARALNRQALETLATPLEATNGWSDLVVNANISRDLKTLEARCKSREALQKRTGPALSHSLNRGVRTLFSGPSGTGKTLAARALACALQMDLYRVDLAAVVNKYIGETERNLNQVLSRAEELDVMLLLDEGDALMTSRTEVRNANDRYANLETNYLLQRLENYEGIVVITTNAASRIDSAFARRIDVVIDFAPPEAAERWLIWQSHLPPAHAISLPFLEEIAYRCALTGGQIRNAALHTTLLALGDGSSINDSHLEAGVRREYRKAGSACPLQAKPTKQGHVDHLRRFAVELS